MEGHGGNAYASRKSSDRDWIEQTKINILVQIGLEKEPELPEVPLLLDEVTSETDKKIVALVSLPTFPGYAHWASPETPTDRVAIQRRAYSEAMTDTFGDASRDTGYASTRKSRRARITATPQQRSHS